MNIETDEVIVNRNGTTYKTTAENMANLEDTDDACQHDGVTYTVTGEESKKAFKQKKNQMYKRYLDAESS